MQKIKKTFDVKFVSKTLKKAEIRKEQQFSIGSPWNNVKGISTALILLLIAKYFLIKILFYLSCYLPVPFSRFLFNDDTKAECPEGVVHENSFKDIYAKFFPHGSEYLSA